LEDKDEDRLQSDDYTHYTADDPLGQVSLKSMHLFIIYSKYIINVEKIIVYGTISKFYQRKKDLG